MLSEHINKKTPSSCKALTAFHYSWLHKPTKEFVSCLHTFNTAIISGTKPALMTACME